MDVEAARRRAGSGGAAVPTASGGPGTGQGSSPARASAPALPRLVCSSLFAFAGPACAGVRSRGGVKLVCEGWIFSKSSMAVRSPALLGWGEHPARLSTRLCPRAPTAAWALPHGLPGCPAAPAELCPCQEGSCVARRLQLLRARGWVRGGRGCQPCEHGQRPSLGALPCAGDAPRGANPMSRS